MVWSQILGENGHQATSPHVSFSDDPSTLVEDSPKKDFVVKIGICLVNWPSEDEVISNKQPVLQAVFFPILFK